MDQISSNSAEVSRSFQSNWNLEDLVDNNENIQSSVEELTVVLQPETKVDNSAQEADAEVAFRTTRNDLLKNIKKLENFRRITVGRVWKREQKLKCDKRSAERRDHILKTHCQHLHKTYWQNRNKLLNGMAGRTVPANPTLKELADQCELALQTSLGSMWLNINEFHPCDGQSQLDQSNIPEVVPGSGETSHSSPEDVLTQSVANALGETGSFYPESTNDQERAFDGLNANPSEYDDPEFLDETSGDLTRNISGDDNIQTIPPTTIVEKTINRARHYYVVTENCGDKVHAIVQINQAKFLEESKLVYILCGDRASTFWLAGHLELWGINCDVFSPLHKLNPPYLDANRSQILLVPEDLICWPILRRAKVIVNYNCPLLREDYLTMIKNCDTIDLGAGEDVNSVCFDKIVITLIKSTAVDRVKCIHNALLLEGHCVKLTQ